ncbi:MAG: peptidoglycan bridge formation glycyltransferase FemA/FemB family protein [Patescibacteria group bacterium]|nr:peptidoglycan bridge formation glycyltransferase FemA/FemB family protein [Patescibacteria group bacterium]
MIREITDRSEWVSFQNATGSPSFLQSWEWGDLNARNSNYGVLRLGCYNASGDLSATAQVLKISAKRGSFLFVPHGPTFGDLENWNSLLSEFRDYLTDIARKEGYAFIRISPVQEYQKATIDCYRDLGFRKAPIYMHAERIWVLPLDKTEDELLANMRKTTRYLIRRAPRDGVKIERRNDPESIEVFWELYSHTAERESFTPFSKTFVDNEFKTFHESGNADYFFGKVGEDYLAGALIVYTESTAFYHQGASRHTKYPVPYALQWEAIKSAKARGCKYYNFWGILQEGRTPKAWAGLTLFKKGFGGKQIDYVPTMDYVVEPFAYAVSWLLESLLQWKRGV